MRCQGRTGNFCCSLLGIICVKFDALGHQNFDAGVKNSDTAREDPQWTGLFFMLSIGCQLSYVPTH